MPRYRQWRAGGSTPLDTDTESARGCLVGDHLAVATERGGRTTCVLLGHDGTVVDEVAVTGSTPTAMASYSDVAAVASAHGEPSVSLLRLS